MTLLAIFEALVGANAIWETTVGQQSLLKIMKCFIGRFKPFNKANNDDLCLRNLGTYGLAD